MLKNKIIIIEYKIKNKTSYIQCKTNQVIKIKNIIFYY